MILKKQQQMLWSQQMRKGGPGRGPRVGTVKLTRDGWVIAAYEALLRGGPRAVAVANLAEDLEVTRGSFYHYFKDRDELLVAALEKWEQEATQTFIDRAANESGPAARLESLFAQVFREPTELASAERRLLANRGESVAVAAVVDRVVARRLAFLAECYRALGYDEVGAEDRATVAYMMFTGWLYFEQPPDHQSTATTERMADLAKEMLLPTE